MGGGGNHKREAIMMAFSKDHIDMAEKILDIRKNMDLDYKNMVFMISKMYLIVEMKNLI